MTRTRDFKGTVIPSAARWEMFSCGHCPNIHLILFDDDDKPFAEAVFGSSSHKRFCDEGHALLAKLRQQNIDKQNDG